MSESKWNECKGFNLPARIVDLTVRLQRVLLADKIRTVESMVSTHDLDPRMRQELMDQLGGLRKTLGETR